VYLALLNLLKRLCTNGISLIKEQTKRIVRSMPAILNALYLFCQASPNLLIPHITTLHPYMKLLVSEPFQSRYLGLAH
jgi:hypothetical protein